MAETRTAQSRKKVVRDDGSIAVEVFDSIHSMTTSPGVTDDWDDGHDIGHLWVNTVLKHAFIAVDVTVGAAVWSDVTHALSTEAVAGLIEKATQAEVDAGTDTDRAVTPATLGATTLFAHHKTGSYTGDGTTSQGITGIGFQPMFVKIWTRETTNNTNVTIHESADVIMDDNAAGGSIDITSSKFETNAIISLDADGFTVDDAELDAHPNTDTIVYNYMAFG